MLRVFFSGWLILLAAGLNAQFTTSAARSWDDYPPEVQKPGFGLFKQVIRQMDTTREKEEVLLFTKDNGHYPYFDVFKQYYVILGAYSKKIKYISEVTLTTDRKLLVEDRDEDGIYELYRKYMKEGRFTTDSAGLHLKTTWQYDFIYWKDMIPK